MCPNWSASQDTVHSITDAGPGVAWGMGPATARSPTLGEDRMILGNGAFFMFPGKWWLLSAQRHLDLVPLLRTQFCSCWVGINIQLGRERMAFWLPHMRHDAFTHRQLALDSSGCGDTLRSSKKLSKGSWMWSQRPHVKEASTICWLHYSEGKLSHLEASAASCIKWISTAYGMCRCKIPASCLACLFPALFLLIH